jgi:hypothetical protein
MIHKGAQKVTKGTKDHKAIPKLYLFSNHTLYSREDPKPLVIANSTIVIVVHFAKVAPCTQE